MSEEILIRCCAPTLAAIKTGSLFNCPFESQLEMTESLRAVNHCLLRKGVTALPLRYREGKALIYLCREGWSLSRLTIQPRQFSYKTITNERKETA